MPRSLVLFLCFLLQSSVALAWKPEVGKIPGKLQKLELAEGSEFDPSSLRGDPVVYYVGAEWCVPCVQTGRPALLKAYERFRERGLKVVYISMDDNSMRARLNDWATSLRLTLLMSSMSECPPGRCTTGTRGDFGEFGRAWRLPSAFVFDSKGVLRAKLEQGGVIRADLEAAIEPLLTK